MIETFWCVRLERSPVIAKYYEGLEGGDGYRKLVYSYFRKKISKCYLVYLLVRSMWQQIIH